jgi:hypothetical protein
MNPSLWKDPELFNPDRFLSSDGTKVVKPEYFIPFGVGRRVCLGDVLAKAELFLFFSTILHTFKLTLPPGATVPDLRGQAGVTVSPQSFKVIISFFNFLIINSINLTYLCISRFVQRVEISRKWTNRFEKRQRLFLIVQGSD